MTTTKDALPELPKAWLFAHELIGNKLLNGKLPGGDDGVWLGVCDLGVCQRAHDPGETGDEIKHLYTADQMRDYALAALASKQAPPEWTPEMSRAVQLYSELGAYAAANLSGAYGLFEEFWNVAHRAALSGPAPAPLSEEQVHRLYLKISAQITTIESPSEMFTEIVRDVERELGIGLDGGM